MLLEVLKLLMRMLAVVLLFPADMEHQAEADHRHERDHDRRVCLRAPRR